MFAVALALWIAWTMRYAAKTRVASSRQTTAGARMSTRDADHADRRRRLRHVYGRWRSAGIQRAAAAFAAGVIAGLLGGLGVEGPRSRISGMQSVPPAAALVGVARSISVVLADGHVIDTILQSSATPLSHTAPAAARCS